MRRRRRRRSLLPAVIGECTERQAQLRLAVAWRRRRPTLDVERDTLAARTAPLDLKIGFVRSAL